jgi:hypothetical protein
MQWFNSSTGKSYLYYSNAWVEIDSNGTATASTGNAIINGAFDIWQRGTTFTASGYGPDRWYLETNTFSLTRQSSNPPLGSRYYSRVTATGSISYCNHIQVIETQNTAQYWGKTITISAKVRRNSAMNVGINLTLQKNSTVDAGVAAAGWANIAVSTISNANITTGTGVNDWSNVVLTANIPNDGTANTLKVIFGETVAMTSGQTWDLANVQLEAGAVATPFRRNGENMQAELAACQRYYYRLNAQGIASRFASGIFVNTTQWNGLFYMPVPMRAMPSVSGVGSGNVYVSDGAFGWGTRSVVSSINRFDITSPANNQIVSVQFSDGSGFPTYRPGWLESVVATVGYEFNAEL